VAALSVEQTTADFEEGLAQLSPDPADLHLLLEGTGLSVLDVEPFTDEG
jgi:hypothetical protein